MSTSPATDLIKIAIWPVLFIVLIVGFWLYARPTPGVRELRLSRDAVRQATSWHLVRSARLPDNSWVVVGIRDVVCPTDFDETTLHPEKNGATSRRLEVQGYNYQQLSTGGWQRLGNGLIKIRECGRGPDLEAFGFLYKDLDEIEKNGDIKMGGVLDSEGVKCQWWHLTTPNVAQPKYSVCVEQNTHLPAVASSETYGFSYNFSKWNQTTVSAPDTSDSPSGTR